MFQLDIIAPGQLMRFGSLFELWKIVETKPLQFLRERGSYSGNLKRRRDDMAERRMFAKSVVESDIFLDMPLTTQALYFHLGMYADDDGFLNNAKRVQRTVGCNDDDFKLLLAKGFIIPFNNGICVIRHWKIHNYIRSDRYKSTLYKTEKAMIAHDPQQGYVLVDTVGIPNGNQMDTQVRIGKYNNICSPDGEREDPNGEKESRNIASKTQLEQDKEDFEKIYAEYPKKRGKAKAFEYYRGYVGKGRAINGIRYHLDRKEIYLAMMTYIHEREQEGAELQFYQDFSTFMNKTVVDYLQKGERI